MTAKLSPHAFRVWDNQERRYFDQHEDCFVLTAAGVLCHLELTPIKTPDGWTSLYTIGDIADPERYTVEWFTGLYDGKRNKQPIFENDRCKYHYKTSGTYQIVEHLGSWKAAHEINGHHFEIVPHHLIVVGTIHDQPETSSK